MCHPGVPQKRKMGPREMISDELKNGRGRGWVVPYIGPVPKKKNRVQTKRVALCKRASSAFEAPSKHLL